MAMTLRLDSHQDRALSLLADAHIAQLAETIIPEQAVLAARIRRNRG